jgi:hypothetical protein
MRVTAVLVALAIAPPAFAGHYYPETDQDKADDAHILEADAAPHSEYALGLRLGSFHTGPVYNFAVGFAIEAGMRFDRLQLVGEYNFLDLSDPPTAAKSTGNGTAALTSDPTTTSPSAPSGYVHRFGALARYSLANFIDADHGMAARGDFYVEGGLGEELVEWSGGGTLHRPDVAIGAAWQMGGRGTERHAGLRIGFRATFAGSPPSHTAATLPTCAGPCDTPTVPSHTIDHSFLFALSFNFGA